MDTNERINARNSAMLWLISLCNEPNDRFRMPFYIADGPSEWSCATDRSMFVAVPQRLSLRDESYEVKLTNVELALIAVDVIGPRVTEWTEWPTVADLRAADAITGDRVVIDGCMIQLTYYCLACAFSAERYAVREVRKGRRSIVIQGDNGVRMLIMALTKHKTKQHVAL